MRKIWLSFVVLLLCVNSYSRTIYFSTTGNDVTGNGNIGTPYASLFKACSVSISGDLVHGVAGNYTQSAVQVIVPTGVSIEGEGFATKITLTYFVAGSGGLSNTAIQLVSAVLNTNGNQSISNIWFDGNNFGCLSGILVRCRGNVTFSHCRFTNFGITAISFYGKTTQTTGTPPPTFSANNSVLNCSFTNCSDRIKQAANSLSAGSVSYSGQRNLLFQFDTVSNATNPLGITHNGNLFGGVQGNNIGTRWLDQVWAKPPDTGNQYNFGIESWYDQGGSEVARCKYTGGGNVIDIGYGGANKGDSAYSWYIHHDTITNPALLTSSGTQPVLSIFVQFEPSKNVNPACPCSSIPLNADIGDARIEYNYLKNVGSISQITLNNFIGNFVDNLYFNHNVGESMGYANNTYSGVFNFVLGLGTRIDSIFIDNNTIVGNHTGTIPGGTAGVGANWATLILQADTGAITDIYFRNNIALYANSSGYLLFRGKYATNRVKSQNNITFKNGFTNNPATILTAVGAGNFVVGKIYTIANIGNTNFVAIGAASNTVGVVFTASGIGAGTGSATAVITPLNFTNTGNLKVDPLFVNGSAPVDYHLAAGSPGISGGLSPPATYIGAYPPGTITPTITWANPADITYGTALSATQLNATSGGVPGTFIYTPAAGTILNAGVGQTLSVTFTPTDQVTYSVVSKQVLINVNKALATLTYSNLTQTFTGSQLTPTVTTNPAGLTVVTTTYNGIGTAPTNAGTYAIVSGLANANYTALTISGTFTINKATAVINASNLTQVYDGTQKSVTATTTPTGLTGLAVTYNGSGTPPTNAGSYPLVITLTNANYTAPTFNGMFVISKATPTVSWANPVAITYGTALGGTQLNATASVSGTFVYTPASGTILNAGTQTLSVDFTPTDATNYNSVNGTTVSIVVNKATATLSLSNLNQVYDGLGKTVTVTSNPVGLGTISITYDGSIIGPVSAGSYAINATLNNSNYTATPATGTLVISKATAILSVTNTVQTYNGTQRSVTVSTVPAGLNTLSILYDDSPLSPTNAGTYGVNVSLSNANYDADPIATTLTINKSTPVISWSNPVAITYGTPLSGTQLIATSNVAGTFTYTPSAGTILNAGNQILVADFVPTDGTNYNIVNGTTVNLTVNQATAVITVSNFNQSFDGNPKPVTVSVNPNVGVITVLYNGSATVPSAIGSYPVNVTLSNSNFVATPVNGTLVISSSSAAVTITNISQTYDGSPKPVTVTTIPAGLPVLVTYNGSATVPTLSGTYAVHAAINDGGIHTGSADATLTINKANPVVSWSNPVAITYGTALSGTQLNASASVAGVLTYTPNAGTILNAGTQTLSVNFVPTDIANYNNVNGTTVTIVVNKATATLSLSNLNQPFDGTPKSVTVTSSPAGLAVVSVTYNGSNTPPSAVGSYPIVATLNNSNYDATPATGNLVISTTSAGISISNINQVYTGGQINVTVTTNPSGLSFTLTYNGSSTPPIAAGSYQVIGTITGGIYTGADTQTLVITKATPIITWPNPANITYGTPLSGTQLNATVNAAGGLVYSPVAGTILSVGTQSLLVTFTPTDPANYNSVTKIVPITVTGASATLTLSNLAQTYNTSPRSVIVTTTPAGLSGVVITYNGSLSIPVNAGTYAINVTLVNDNYTATSVNGTLVVAKINPVLSWSTPQPIQLATPLSATQLNATSNVAGTFTYSPTFGAALPEGVTGVVATFHPTDNVNYNTLTITVPITVYGNPLQLWYIITGNPDYQNLPGQNIIFPY